MKARTTLDNSEKPGFADARGSLSPSTDSRSTSHQAYVDLMKSSYILYDIVLIDENSRANLTDENRKLIADLSEVCLLAFLDCCANIGIGYQGGVLAVHVSRRPGEHVSVFPEYQHLGSFTTRREFGKQQ